MILTKITQYFYVNIVRIGDSTKQKKEEIDDFVFCVKLCVRVPLPDALGSHSTLYSPLPVLYTSAWTRSPDGAIIGHREKYK